MTSLQWVRFMLLAAFSAGALAAQHQPLADIPVRKQSGINYVSGGMTDDERKEMQRVSNKYPMQLVFIAGDNQAPIKGVKVTVKDLKGSPQIEAVADGPYFFFNPPSGRWIVDAEYNGEVVSRTVDLIGRRYMLLEFKFKGGIGVPAPVRGTGVRPALTRPSPARGEGPFSLLPLPPGESASPSKPLAGPNAG